jgi:hypothetical protein
MLHFLGDICNMIANISNSPLVNFLIITQQDIWESVFFKNA